MSALPSTLDSVTVFREGAICRRYATVRPQAERQLSFAGLPLSLDAGSLRARVVRGANTVLDVRAQFDVQLADEIDVPVERRAFEAASEALSQLELEAQRTQREIDELQALAPGFLEPKRGEPPRTAPIDAILALGDFREAQLSPRLERRRELERLLFDARAEKTLRARRLEEASTARRSERARLTRAASVTLARPAEEELLIELEYRVPGARWVPSYALTLERGMTGGTLQLRASVAQNTGEDWSQVQLSLSTASIGRRADMPELKSLRIGRRQDAPKPSGWREPPPGLDALFESYDAAMPPVVRAEPVAIAAPPPPPPVVAKPIEQGKMAMRATMARAGAPAAAPVMSAPAAFSVGGAAPGAAPMKKLAERRRAEAPRDEELEESSYDELSAPMAELAAADDFGGAYPQGEAPDEPSADAQLDAQLGDYTKLMMAPGYEPGRRGRLTPLNEWETGFSASVSFQVNVAMNVVTRARSIAQSVASLPLPTSTQAVQSIDSFDYRYDAAARHDVPSTGKWVLLPVMTCEVGLAPEYVCVPSVESKVYRTLTVANRSTHALLPGPVDVTSGDTFLLTTTLPAIAPGAAQSHRLGLGVEEAIKVSRKTHFKETTGGFLGGSAVLPHEIEIELQNRLGSPALVEVRERVPWASGSEKDLKVEETQSTPPWERVDTPVDGELVRGARRWRVTLQPGQPQKLTAQFAIRMPADRMLVGGNRRS